MAIAGVVVHAPLRAPRAEARAIGAVALAYLVYNAGYWLPMGGGSPGPRFLIPILPFLAIGLGPAWRRWPAVTLALTAISATTMVAATMSYPMIGTQDPGEWVRRLVRLGLLSSTACSTSPGSRTASSSILPFALLVGLALGLGVSSLGRAAARASARGGRRSRSASGRCARSCSRGPLRAAVGGRDDPHRGCVG